MLSGERPLVEAGSVLERIWLRRLTGNRRTTQKEFDVDGTGSELKSHQLAGNTVHCKGSCQQRHTRDTQGSHYYVMLG